VAVGLSLMGCGLDPARKNAALFFALSLHVRAVLEAFDAQEGLRRLLSPLSNLLALQRAGSAADLRTERGVCYHVSRALLQYARSHLALHVAACAAPLAAAAPPPPPPQPASAAAASTSAAAAAAQDALALSVGGRALAALAAPLGAPWHKAIDISPSALAALAGALEQDAGLARALALCVHAVRRALSPLPRPACRLAGARPPRIALAAAALTHLARRRRRPLVCPHKTGRRGTGCSALWTAAGPS